MIDKIFEFLVTHCKKSEIIIGSIVIAACVLVFFFYRIQEVEASLKEHETMLIERDKRLHDKIDRNYDKLVEFSENLANVDNQILLVLGEIRDEVGYLRGRTESMDNNIN